MDNMYDSYNAPRYMDFKNINDNDEIDEVDKFFDIHQELPQVPSTPLRETFDVVPPSNIENTPNHDINVSSNEDKENVTPKSATRKRSKMNQSSADRSGSSILAEMSTYMTPGTSKRKSQIVYMNNGRSLQVQNYEGIALVTPNKTHLMETRLDAVIKSPGIYLRSRSVHREAMKEISTERMHSTRKSNRLQHEDIVESVHEDSPVAASYSPNIPNQPLIVEQKAHEAKETVHAPIIKTVRPAPPQYRAPMVALHPSEGPGKKRQNSALPNKAVKFMAAAEVVHHFQRDTPERFHSLPVRSALQNKMHIRKAKQYVGPRPNTIPKSPFLSTKMRQNSKFTEHIPSHVEKEQQELEEIKNYKIKAKPVVRSVLLPRPCKDMHVSKTPTRIQPFNLSQGKRKEPTPEPVYRFKAQPLPRGMLASPTGLPPRHELPLTQPHSPNLRITAKYPKRVKVETPGNQTKEVGHFGVKNVPSRTVTKVEPFSFEERDKQLQQRKQELVEKQLEEERLAREFKAQKLPLFTSPSLPERKRIHLTTAHTPQISAYSRGIQNQLKFQQQLAEENAKKRSAAQFKARPATVTHKRPFEPVLPKRILNDVTELKLNTERRAVDRAEFDVKLKIIAAEKEEQKAQLLALREAEACEEEARLRREAEFKATELRPTTPLKIVSSSKALTQPQSPMLLVKERATRSFRQSAN